MGRRGRLKGLKGYFVSKKFRYLSPTKIFPGDTQDYNFFNFSLFFLFFWRNFRSNNFLVNRSYVTIIFFFIIIMSHSKQGRKDHCKRKELRLSSNKTAPSARTGWTGSAHTQRLLRMRTSRPHPKLDDLKLIKKETIVLLFVSPCSHFLYDQFMSFLPRAQPVEQLLRFEFVANDVASFDWLIFFCPW